VLIGLFSTLVIVATAGRPCALDAVCDSDTSSASLSVTMSLQLQSARQLRATMALAADDVPGIYRVEVLAIAAGVPNGGTHEHKYLVIGPANEPLPGLTLAFIGDAVALDAPDNVAVLPWSQALEAEALAQARSAEGLVRGTAIAQCQR
jgi:hypothetical protein